MKEPLPPNPIIPRRLMSVILKATEKEQSRRYLTALEFKQAIITSMEEPSSFWDNLKSWILDNLKFIMTISVFALAAIVYCLFLVLN